VLREVADPLGVRLPQFVDEVASGLRKLPVRLTHALHVRLHVLEVLPDLFFGEPELFHQPLGRGE